MICLNLFRLNLTCFFLKIEVGNACMDSFMQMHVSVYRVMLFAVPDGTDASPNYLSQGRVPMGRSGNGWTKFPHLSHRLDPWPSQGSG